MPLVKGIQQELGEDKFEVLLLSVDHDYGTNSVAEDNKRLKKQGVNWPNVILPHGFDDTQRLFNFDGYGLCLIGPNGIVKGIDLVPDQIAKLLNLDSKPSALQPKKQSRL
jgi:hypothetical protein